ncbi:MAG: hypothetical protein DMD29_14160, partial [Gemmatimonadetes bacterium]
FTATLKDLSGSVLTGLPIAWTSSNPTVATVTESGLATAVAAGSTTISATGGGVTDTATLTVTAPAPVNPGTVTDLLVSDVTDSSVTLSFTEVNDGAGRPASYDIRWAAGALSWGSASDVSRGSCLVPLSGTAIGAKRNCTVVGLAPATGYRFQTVAFRGTLNVNAVFGRLSDVASGITAAAGLAPVASVTVTPGNDSLTVGAKPQLTATLKDARGDTLTGRPVAWASNAPAVATVSANGVVTAVATGSATITATSEDQSGTAAITVTPVPVASVTVAPANDSLPVGATPQFTATLKGASGDTLTGRSVTWASDAPAVATVSANGVVTAVATGSATITATSEGKSGTAAVTVKQVPVASVTVTPGSASLAVGATRKLVANLKDASGNTLSGRTVTWASNAPTVATVNGSGQVRAVSADSAMITATSEGQSGRATITVTAPVITNPGKVTDLNIAGVTDSAVTLSFTEVTDGTGLPAGYFMRFAVAPLAWSSATDAAQGSCTVPVAGSAIGATRSCTVLGLQSGVTYQFQLVAFRGTLNVNAVFGALSNLASGTTTASTAPVASVTLSPASANVVVGAVEQLTATLKDAAGNVLTGRTVTWASSALGVATVSGNGLVTGLVVGSATITATSEGQSGTAALTVVAAGPGGVVFQSDWNTVGTAFSDVTDGGRWGNYWEFNNGTGVQLMSVVSGASVNGPGGRNSLKVLQRGSTFAANVQQDNVLPASTDYYVRYYMRNDDTSPAGDHIVTPDTWQYSNLIYMRKASSGTGWTFVIGLYGCGSVYPIVYWHPEITFSHGVWYRFEYSVHFVDPTHIQVHPRVYDASGTLLFSDSTFLQQDYGQSGSLSWAGNDHWTLATFYAAGYTFCVVPQWLTSIGMGNNGQQGATDTGLPWYFAGVQIRTDWWPGP